jgi:endonuclease/exonuclease/phosphatase family metal-dependent hydrolase
VVSPAPGHRHDRQVDLLGDLLGFRHRAFYPHISRRGGMDYGNAVLSRWPITESQHIDLTVPYKKKRAVVHTRIRMTPAAGKPRTLHVYNLHLGLSGFERKVQLRRFLASHPFSGLDHRAPIVVGGDFNDVWGTLGPKILEPAGFRGLPRTLATFPAFAPVRALDALYVRGDIRIDQSQRGHLKLCRFASDHLPLIADMRLS